MLNGDLGTGDAFTSRLELLVVHHGALIAQCDDITIVLYVAIVVFFAHALHVPLLLHLVVVLPATFKQLKARLAFYLLDFCMRDGARMVDTQSESFGSPIDSDCIALFSL